MKLLLHPCDKAAREICEYLRGQVSYPAEIDEQAEDAVAGIIERLVGEEDE